MDMACWGLIPRFWVKDKGFKEDDAVWGELKQKGADAPPEATELREGAFVATILCDDREEEMEENMEQVRKTGRDNFFVLILFPKRQQSHCNGYNVIIFTIKYRCQICKNTAISSFVTFL